ncbi:RHS repeat domain-containing protein [Xanthomonas theicola]
MQAGTQTEVVYAYDGADRLTGLSQGNETVSLAYDAANRLIRQTLPNQVQSVYSYNAAGQVTGLGWGKAGQSALGRLGYGYDGSGQLVAQTGTHAPQALPSASGDHGFDDNNRQTRANGVGVNYDANGHLLDDGGRRYVWDERERLSQIRQGETVIASYRYDGLGRRIEKTEGGTTTQYLYDGLDAVQETQGDTVNPLLTGLGIDQRYARNDTGGRTYLLTDRLGSTRLLTNAAGNAVQRYDYDPYGTTTQSSTAYTNPYQYTGREKDASGLYYYRARYYRPEWGRFVSEDPIGLAGGINGYGYVDQNPINYIDPLGLIKWTGTSTGGGVSAGVGGGFYRFSLDSECINGQQGHAEIVAVGATIGVEIKGVPPFSLTTSSITVRDELNYINPNVMNGWFSMWSAGVTVGVGYGISMIQIGGDGGALSPPERSGAYNPFESGLSRGFEIGAGGMVGSSTVVDSSISRCGCK